MTTLVKTNHAPRLEPIEPCGRPVSSVSVWPRHDGTLVLRDTSRVPTPKGTTPLRLAGRCAALPGAPNSSRGTAVQYMYSACSSAAGSAARGGSCCCWIQIQYWICDAYAYNCTTVRVHEQSYTYGTGSSTVFDLLLDLYSTGNSTIYKKKQHVSEVRQIL